MRAPSVGVVTQLTVRPGMMAGISLAKPVMVFEPRDDAELVGWFRQNSLWRLAEGNEGEVAFDALPGKVFKGRVAVVIEIEDPAFEQYDLPNGVFGQSAIYTEHAHHVAVLRRILLRMASWLDYLFPFH